MSIQEGQEYLNKLLPVLDKIPPCRKNLIILIDIVC